MLQAISNTSPILFLFRIGAIGLLPQLFSKVWITQASIEELDVARKKGYQVPDSKDYDWLSIQNPSHTPSEWFASDLGKGEIAAMSLALEWPQYILLLDDAPARRLAKAAGLQVWGTLGVLLESKKNGYIPAVAPFVNQLEDSGMWLSNEIRQRILQLAGEWPHE